MMLGAIILGLIALALAAFVGFVLHLRLQAKPPALERLEGEDCFLAAPGQKVVATPSITDLPSIYLSLVIPAYKETKRLPVMLDETLAYLAQRKAKQKEFTFEVVIVDDGSNDGTAECALEYSSKHPNSNIRVLKLQKNRGKGGAVKWGMLSSRGRYLLMVDADGATRISDIEACEKKLMETEKGGQGIAVGSRAHMEDEAKATRSFLRNLLMHGFHFLVYILCVKSIRDTQCGFKLFCRKSAEKTFHSLHIERWAFDVELLYIAQASSIPLVEVAVNWEEIEGSKLDPLWSSVQMGYDLLRIRLSYVFGFWKL